MLYNLLKYLALWQGVVNEWKRRRQYRAMTTAEVGAVLKQAYIGPVRDALNQPSIFLQVFEREADAALAEAMEGLKRQTYTDMEFTIPVRAKNQST